MKVLVVAIALCAACTVNRKSDSFECTSDATCKDGRTCMDGFCVTGLGDAGSGSNRDPACASQCTSCDHSTSPPTCVIAGTSGAFVTCPDDAPCRVTCAQSGACSMVTCPAGAPSCTIDCTGPGSCGVVGCDADRCNVVCSGTTACGNVTCGASGGTCDVSCSGTNGCNQVSCDSACACDVTCANKPSCGALTCPTLPSGGFCTTTGSDGAACRSSPTGCNRC